MSRARAKAVRDLHWPPRSADEMRGWQRAIGTDLQIALYLRLSRASIYGQRTKYGVPALPRKVRKRVSEKAITEHTPPHAIAKVYAGRRYEDWGAA